MAEYMTQLEAIEQCYRLGFNKAANGLKVWHIMAGQAKLIRIAARRLSRQHLSLCNGVIGADGFAKWDEADQTNYERKCRDAEKMATAAFHTLFPRGLALDWQRDPRGPSIIVYDRKDTDGQNRLASFW